MGSRLTTAVLFFMILAASPLSGLMAADRYLVLPCPTDRWNTSPHRWADVDFRGHLEGRAVNGMPFMRLCYSLDGGRLMSLVDNYIIDEPGRLLLAPSDREGGGSLNNTGSIRVKIIRIR